MSRVELEMSINRYAQSMAVDQARLHELLTHIRHISVAVDVPELHSMAEHIDMLTEHLMMTQAAYEQARQQHREYHEGDDWK